MRRSRNRKLLRTRRDRSRCTWPEEATSGLAKLLPIARQPLPVCRKPQILASELNSQINNPNQKAWTAEGNSGDLATSNINFPANSIPVVGSHPVALCASLPASTQRNTRITGENRPPTAISDQTGSRNMAKPHKRTRRARLAIRLHYNI